MTESTSIERRAVIQGAAGLGLALGGVGAAQAVAAQESGRTGRFAGKRVLITGGSSGIGRAGARRVAAEGGTVAVTGQTPAHLDAVRRELPEGSIVLRNDSGDPSAVAELVEAVRSMGGGLDGLWLNAAFATIAPLEEITTADFNRMIAVNMRGPMLQLAALSPLLNPGASVLLTASSSAYEGADVTPLYGSSKSAGIAAVRSWARQLAPRRIRVNSLVPGPIKTNIRRHLPQQTRRQFETDVIGMVPLQRFGTGEEAAAVALFWRRSRRAAADVVSAHSRDRRRAAQRISSGAAGLRAATNDCPAPAWRRCRPAGCGRAWPGRDRPRTGNRRKPTLAPIFEHCRARVTMTLAGNAFIRSAKPMVANAHKLVAMLKVAGQGPACYACSQSTA